ncbi:MAG: hypothetical protein M3548_02470 [Actinomycetota bacterium]|nr:hypothetical protein [Actinomycetota bacterium]
MASNLVRLLIACVLIVPTAEYVPEVGIAVFGLFTALIVVVLFCTSLFRTRTEKGL